MRIFAVGCSLRASTFVHSLLLSFCVQSEASPAEPPVFAEYDRMIKDACLVHSSSEACGGLLKRIGEGLPAAELTAGTPALPIDASLEVRVAKGAEDMLSNYYCLAAQIGLVRPQSFPPESFAYAVRGLSFGKEAAGAYGRWLASPEARPCREALAELKIEPVAALALRRRRAVVLNPTSLLEFGADEHFRDAVGVAYGHERLHVLFDERGARKKSLELWKSRTDGEREQFKKEHPSYDFGDVSILAREHFSYVFEESPERALDFLAARSISRWKRDHETRLCRHCVAGDPDATSKLTKLAGLQAAELLKKIEGDGVRVRIVESGRSLPSPFFSWGSVRRDPGSMSQVSEAKDAFGKTLCKGERPESSDGLTIVISADSPYSTLLHEYVHVLQIRKDRSWCAVSKMMWGKKKVGPREARLALDREWDARVALWDLRESKQMTLEDRLSILDGLWTEGEARKAFDPRAAEFTAKNDIRAKRDSLAIDYLQAIRFGR